MSTSTEHTEPAPPAAPRSPGYEWQWGWALAVAVNLPVPLLFGLLVVAKGGLFGMLAGIVVLWLVGVVAIAQVPPLRSTLVIGGLLFAPSQFLPIAQIAAGIVAVELCDTKPEPMSELTGFFVTLVTGGQLLLAVLVVGLLLRVLGRLTEERILRMHS